MVEIKTSFGFFALLVLIIISSVILVSAVKHPSPGSVIVVSAAASLTDAVNDIITEFNSRYPGITVKTSFGGSGYLATQIENGAPVDLFISADERDAARLIQQNFAQARSKSVFCENTLVLAGLKDSKKLLQSEALEKIFKTSTKIGIGNPDYVAAGFYTMSLLDGSGLSDTFSQKFVKGNSVRQVLGWLESGAVDYAFIYKTDALLSSKIVVYKEYPIVKGRQITYPVILTSRGEKKPAAEHLREFLKTEKPRDILKHYGFTVTKS